MGGLVTGRVYCLRHRVGEFPRTWVCDNDVPHEIRRFKKALVDCADHLRSVKSRLSRLQGRETLTILDSHILLLEDELLVRNTEAAIERLRINAEWAVHETLNEIRKSFTHISQAYLRQRANDIDSIEGAIQRSLSGTRHSFKIPARSIVFADQLSPAEVVLLIRLHVAGLVMESGGMHSHTAIVARSAGIPCIMGVSRLMESARDGTPVMMDADRGMIVIGAGLKESTQFEKRQKERANEEWLMRQESQWEAMTPDGHLVKVLANVEMVEEARLVKNFGASGVGLYRTEFLFIDRVQPPSEQEQEKVYRRVLSRLKPLEVTIRTLDLGADKVSGSMPLRTVEFNPALGLRAIRLCLKEKKLFESQLRALLKASDSGRLKICIPMVTSTDEFCEVRQMVDKVAHELKKEGLSLPDHLPIGAMIEIPSAVMEMDLLAPFVDFFSIGTNDLIQYMLAVDRTNEDVAHLYHPLHPSILRTLKKITENGRQFGREITLCGEIAAEPLYLHLLLGLGFDRFSMNVTSIPRIKKIIRLSPYSKAVELVERLLACQTSREIQKILEGRMGRLFPELMPH